MANFSPPNRPRAERSSAALCLAVLLLSGAGCDLDARVGLRNPFIGIPSPEDRSEAVTASLGRTSGASFVLHPSYLGVTGAVDALIGAGTETRVRLTGSGTGTASIAWERGAETGTVLSKGFERSRSLLLPAFWKAGEREADGNGLLWLSPEAYQELNTLGMTDLRIGLGDGAFDAASKALQAFNAIAKRLSVSATSTPSVPDRPFAAALKGESSVFPVRIDGKLERLRVLTVRSWFAEYVILKNPENPLVLKVSVNPVSMEALRAFAPEGVDPQAVGYEITALTSAPASP